jgi:hypothetical protein
MVGAKPSTCFSFYFVNFGARVSLVSLFPVLYPSVSCISVYLFVSLSACLSCLSIISHPAFLLSSCFSVSPSISSIPLWLLSRGFVVCEIRKLEPACQIIWGCLAPNLQNYGMSVSGSQLHHIMSVNCVNTNLQNKFYGA